MWILLSIGTAFFAGTSDALTKYILQSRSSRLVAFIKASWGTVFLFPLIFFASPPTNHSAFWFNVLLAMPLEVGASLLFQASLQSSPLSLTIPFLAFTPVFLVGLGWIFLNEIPTFLGILGILLVTSGAFFLQSNEIIKSLKNFPQSILREKGSWMMLIVAFIYAITSVLAKKALLASSPLYFSGIYYSLIAFGLFFFVSRSPTFAKDVFSSPKIFAMLGLCEAAAFLMQFFALLSVETAYVISIKRLSLLLAVIYGTIIFKEKKIISRFAGIALMILGAILISFH